ncbi:MAG: sigma-70 family RNA polymerase sigma factor [Planctomycetota bacterium]
MDERIDRQTAIDEVLLRYLPRVEAWIRRHAGRRTLGKESGTDLSQSVCREVLQDIARGKFEYRGEHEFKKWLYQAASLKVQSRARFYAAERRDVGREVGSEHAPAMLQELFKTLCTPSRDAGAREDLHRLELAFARLPALMQRVVVLARFEGRSHREIAAELDTTESHSRVLLSRALARLATIAGE